MSRTEKAIVEAVTFRRTRLDESSEDRQAYAEYKCRRRHHKDRQFRAETNTL